MEWIVGTASKITAPDLIGRTSFKATDRTLTDTIWNLNKKVRNTVKGQEIDVRKPRQRFTVPPPHPSSSPHRRLADRVCEASLPLTRVGSLANAVKYLYSSTQTGSHRDTYGRGKKKERSHINGDVLQ